MPAIVRGLSLKCPDKQPNEFSCLVQPSTLLVSEDFPNEAGSLVQSTTEDPCDDWPSNSSGRSSPLYPPTPEEAPSTDDGAFIVNGNEVEATREITTLSPLCEVPTNDAKPPYAATPNDILDHLLAGAEQVITVTDLLDAARKTFKRIDGWFEENSK